MVDFDDDIKRQLHIGLRPNWQGLQIGASKLERPPSSLIRVCFPLDICYLSQKFEQISSSQCGGLEKVGRLGACRAFGTTYSA